MSCVIELNGGTHPVVQMIKVVPNSTIELLPLRLPNPDPIIQGSGEAVGLAWVGTGADKAVKSAAMSAAMAYVAENHRPASTPLARVVEVCKPSALNPKP